MLKADLEKFVEKYATETTAIKTDLKWIKQGVDKIDNHLKELNHSVSKVKIKTNNHEIKINTIEEDITNKEEQEKKEKWFKKEHIWSLIGAIIVGLLFLLTSHFL